MLIEIQYSFCLFDKTHVQLYIFSISFEKAEQIKPRFIFKVGVNSPVAIEKSRFKIENF